MRKRAVQRHLRRHSDAEFDHNVDGELRQVLVFCNQASGIDVVPIEEALDGLGPTWSNQHLIEPNAHKTSSVAHWVYVYCRPKSGQACSDECGKT